jgi:RND family efflux transporter MFP subunit
MTMRIKRLSTIFFILLSFFYLYAHEGWSQGPPPAKVVVSGVSSGVISPEAEFIGTVYYKEVSEVAAEVRGMVEKVGFEEGDRVKKGKILVRLDSELLEKSIEARRASHEQVLSDLERASIDLKRVENLFKEEFISEQIYDENRFRVKGLEKRAASLRAELEGLNVELRKKSIKAPFAGVVIEKQVDRGEWVEPGEVVATVAKDDIVDIIVDVPEEVMRSVKPGQSLLVTSAGKEVRGKVFAIVPRGDIQTRTFPVKIRVKNTISLIEGMEARVSLPRGEKKKAIIVPRDALISQFGTTVVFAVVENKAKKIPVKVIGYSGGSAGVESGLLRSGMKVVIKGNERLRDGQEVSVMGDKR